MSSRIVRGVARWLLAGMTFGGAHGLLGTPNIEVTRERSAPPETKPRK
jgi:hypothetical protein